MQVNNDNQTLWNIIDYKLDKEKGATLGGNKHVLITGSRDQTQQVRVVNNSFEAFFLYLMNRWEGVETQWVSGKNLSQIKNELTQSDAKTQAVGQKVLVGEKEAVVNAEDAFRDESLDMVKKEVSNFLIQFLNYSQGEQDPFSKENYDELFASLRSIEKVMHAHESYFNNRVGSEPNPEDENINSVIVKIRENLLKKDKEGLQKVVNTFIPVDNEVRSKELQRKGEALIKEEIERPPNFDEIREALQYKAVKTLKDLKRRSEEGGVNVMYSKEFDDLKLELWEHNKKYGDDIFPAVTHPQSYFGKINKEGALDRYLEQYPDLNI